MRSGKESLKMPLNQAQIEILRLLSRNLDDNDLKEIKRRIVQYLAEKLDKITDKVWEEKGLTTSDIEKLLNTHLRTSSDKK
ncbi:MAG: hypothetical protein SF052_09725 [Bacteroidia bacterium]|nr:hypothetical protein [Bacteroidia bacterium]